MTLFFDLILKQDNYFDGELRYPDTAKKMKIIPGQTVRDETVGKTINPFMKVYSRATN